MEQGISRDTYLKLCDQMNMEPDESKMPPIVEDFPEDIQKAVILFNKLGDRIYPDIGYIGKDYTKLSNFMEFYEVQNKKLFLEALLRLDAKVIEKSQEAMKRARDKASR